LPDNLSAVLWRKLSGSSFFERSTISMGTEPGPPLLLGFRFDAYATSSVTSKAKGSLFPVQTALNWIRKSSSDNTVTSAHYRSSHDNGAEVECRIGSCRLERRRGRPVLQFRRHFRTVPSPGLCLYAFCNQRAEAPGLSHRPACAEIGLDRATKQISGWRSRHQHRTCIGINLRKVDSYAR
jgi:hypothetical protein